MSINFQLSFQVEKQVIARRPAQSSFGGADRLVEKTNHEQAVLFLGENE